MPDSLFVLFGLSHRVRQDFVAHPRHAFENVLGSQHNEYHLTTITVVSGGNNDGGDDDISEKW